MNSNKTMLVLVVLLLGAILAVLVYQGNRPRTTGEKIEDAVNSAADDIGDAVEEVGEDIQDSTR